MSFMIRLMTRHRGVGAVPTVSEAQQTSAARVATYCGSRTRTPVKEVHDLHR
jgi:hypothetical protein